MRGLIPILMLSLSTICAAQEPNKKTQIAEALQALPEALRDGATVFGYVRVLGRWSAGPTTRQ